MASLVPAPQRLKPIVRYLGYRFSANPRNLVLKAESLLWALLTRPYHTVKDADQKLLSRWMRSWLMVVSRYFTESRAGRRGKCSGAQRNRQCRETELVRKKMGRVSSELIVVHTLTVCGTELSQISEKSSTRTTESSFRLSRLGLLRNVKLLGRNSEVHLRIRPSKSGSLVILPRTEHPNSGCGWNLPSKYRCRPA